MKRQPSFPTIVLSSYDLNRMAEIINSDLLNFATDDDEYGAIVTLAENLSQFFADMDDDFNKSAWVDEATYEPEMDE